MASETVLDRARADIAAGRPWKARDRLRSHLARLPTDQAALELMGEVLYGMRDLPDASRYWQLTERSGVDVVEARAAFDERYGRSPVEAYKALPLKRARADEYPSVVAALVGERRAAALAAGYREVEPETPYSSSRLDDLVLFVFIAALVGPFLIGVITIISFLTRAAS